MKTLITCTLAVLFVSGCYNANLESLSSSSPSGGGGGGNSAPLGSSSNPYLISQASDLALLNQYPTAYFSLQNDLDLTGLSQTPIGTLQVAFQGVLSGNHHTISGISISQPGVDYAGFIAVLDTTGLVEDLNVSGTVSGAKYSGLLVGASSGQMVNCTANGTVTGTTFVGGLVGMANHVTHSSFSGTVNGTSYVGGLAGSISNSLDSSYAQATVNGHMNVGGILGAMGSATIQNSYAVGYVVGNTSSSNLGGFIGYSPSGQVINSFAAVQITFGASSSFYNAFVGQTAGSPVFSGNHYDTASTIYTDSHASGLNASQMASQGSFSGWDFSTIWAAPGASGHPTLQ